MHYDSAKYLWDKPKNIYVGDAKVNIAKFEILKMKEDEDIVA